MKEWFVYILASRKGGSLYVGVTNDLVRRIAEHQGGVQDGFTKRYRVYKLVYVESHTDIRIAIYREKRLKRWRRKWKVRLIEENNPDWVDLSTKDPRPRSRSSGMTDRGRSNSAWLG